MTGSEVQIIIVGIDGWEEYTLPAVESILKYEPAAWLVVVDAASKTPYPAYPGVDVLRLDESPSYAYAINQAIEASPHVDGYLILNNDVLCTAPFLHLLDGLPDNAIYGRQIITENSLTWLGLWLCLLPRKIYEKVGAWDEDFKLCGFEDADYCLRAKQDGFETQFLDLPFFHLWGKTRWGLTGYENVRQANREHFREKHGWLPGVSMVVTHE